MKSLEKEKFSFFLILYLTQYHNTSRHFLEWKKIWSRQIYDVTCTFYLSLSRPFRARRTYNTRNWTERKKDDDDVFISVYVRYIRLLDPIERRRKRKNTSPVIMCVVYPLRMASLTWWKEISIWRCGTLSIGSSHTHTLKQPRVNRFSFSFFFLTKISAGMQRAMCDQWANVYYCIDELMLLRREWFIWNASTASSLAKLSDNWWRYPRLQKMIYKWGEKPKIKVWNFNHIGPHLRHVGNFWCL